MTPEAPSRRGSDFAELSREVKQAGLLDRRIPFYLWRLGGVLAALAATGVALVLIGDSWWQLAVAAVLAVVFTQIAFLGHDAGHRQVFAGKRANETTGLLLGNLLIGVGYGWWMGKHSRHHANPNHEDEDPDVDIAVLAFSAEQAQRKRGFFRFVVRNQAWLFFPLLLLEGFSLHAISTAAAVRRSVRGWRLELVLLAVHVVGYLTAVFLVMSPLKAVAFIAVHQGLFGVYMGCSFAPNHKGMPVLSAGHQLDFLRKQVLTSRNVTGNWFTDVLLGGLNYQIEHHLFPSMPRPNLRRAQVIVRDFCARHAISYAECGLFTSYGHVLRHLHEAGAELRGAAALAPAASK
ncbi:fatty acid desaturase family protein [Saccharothrix coeruleofusca]|uniref:Fatty acid desaturase n=1 Tax=Saccharothrix coeruleofusca TaxID=33919 RepID=A0A918AIT4_9PSEU|nr:acyl-CoA desaturase [Saccharothrix coeruleofusca]MBP2334085.1 fatty acid desaturase [Saccharothrix coeruleofusca]GGP43532.1 fatty acid desaturase [Saccharothrix coeruleofusca]